MGAAGIADFLHRLAYRCYDIYPLGITLLHAVISVDDTLLYTIMSRVAFSPRLESLLYVAVLMDGSLGREAWPKCSMSLEEDFVRIAPCFLVVSGGQRQIYQFQVTADLRQRLQSNQMLKVSRVMPCGDCLAVWPLTPLLLACMHRRFGTSANMPQQILSGRGILISGSREWKKQKGEASICVRDWQKRLSGGLGCR